jgi:hypothetical protein
MRSWPKKALVWVVVYPFLLGAGGFATGGVSLGVGCFVAAAIPCYWVARKLQARVSGGSDTQASVAAADRFKRWWSFSIMLLVVAVALTYVSAGTRAGTITLASAVLAITGGGVALAVMRHSGNR